MALAAGGVIELNDENFRSLLDGDIPVLIDACAEFCGPCKLIEPVLDRCAENWGDNLVVSRYDVQSKNHAVKVELLLKGVMPKSLPSLILFQNNKVATTWNGVLSDAELEELLQENLTSNQAKAPEPALVSSRKSGYSNQAKPPETEPEPEPALVATRKSGYVSFASSSDDYMLTP
jgi:thioredoxin 1